MVEAKIRLYVDHPLSVGQSIPLEREQAHYLFGVMRLTTGAYVALFNSRDGEFVAEVTEAGKRGGVLTCVEKTRELQMPPDLWLLFAPIKKARTDFIVEKAAEMGANASYRCRPISPIPNVSGRIGCKRMPSRLPSNAAGPMCPRYPIW